MSINLCPKVNGKEFRKKSRFRSPQQNPDPLHRLYSDNNRKYIVIPVEILWKSLTGICRTISEHNNAHRVNKTLFLLF